MNSLYLSEKRFYIPLNSNTVYSMIYIFHNQILRPALHLKMQRTSLHGDTNNKTKTLKCTIPILVFRTRKVQ